ncbi:hypothetical protein RclHR1_06390011 [Rhizophagus clarus]|uniref:T9SS type A sorting domain-containing protein n=1 Tax=Rhizophagus clarus TaxID=94130 RepID=A0A2Z6RU00_9GLOM|nr:hypothetical protein RclHR1_06390011 [Rhizophagus clarus]GES73558.1 T9SS type A sorting domain-containing protein [Rhizophagus clarus]
MVNAQEWLDSKYPTAGIKAGVKRIGGPKQNLKNIIGIGQDLFSVFIKNRPLTSLLSNVINDGAIENNISLEGPLSLKGFFNLEVLDIEGHKITALDISDCSQLLYLVVLTNIDFTGLDKIEKIFCSGNKLANLDFLKTINPTNLITLRMDGNNFPARDLSCFTPFVKLERLYICNNPFYGSLKPLRNLKDIKGIGIAGTNIDNGLEYLPEEFFDVNAIASNLGLTGGYFTKTLTCSGKPAEQLENYKIENDPLRNYNWQAWKRDNQELINKAKEKIKQEELEGLIIKTLEWEVVAKEIKEFYEQL